MRLVVGRIVRPHGVRGEVVVEPRTDRPDLRFVADRAVLTSSDDHLVIRSVRPHGQRLIVRFHRVADRDTAERLRGVTLVVDSADPRAPDLIAADPGDTEVFLDARLVGLEARQPDGTRIGQVVGVEHGPLQDILVLQRDSGRHARVPFVAAIVPEVNLSDGWLEVDPPEGLLDLDVAP